MSLLLQLRNAPVTLLTRIAIFVLRPRIIMRSSQLAPAPIVFIMLNRHLRSGLFLLLLPQSAQTNTGDLYDLESHTGNITLGFALTTETGKQYLVVLVDKVQTTVIGDYQVN